jgi:hypothetical protein
MRIKTLCKSATYCIQVHIVANVLSVTRYMVKLRSRRGPKNQLFLITLYYIAFTFITEPYQLPSPISQSTPINTDGFKTGICIC